MLRSLYDRTMALASGPNAPRALAGVSFAESSFFPIPPDVLLVPMVLAERAKWARFALLCTVASVLGGAFGYLIGWVAFDQIARPVLAFYGYGDKVEEFIVRFQAIGPWIVFIAGVTPFPYKVVTVTSGAALLSFPVFVLASLASRGLRFFVVAGLLYWFGPPVRAFIERRLGLVFTLGVVLLVGGFVALRYVR